MKQGVRREPLEAGAEILQEPPAGEPGRVEGGRRAVSHVESKPKRYGTVP